MARPPNRRTLGALAWTDVRTKAKHAGIYAGRISRVPVEGGRYDFRFLNTVTFAEATPSCRVGWRAIQVRPVCLRR